MRSRHLARLAAAALVALGCALVATGQAQAASNGEILTAARVGDSVQIVLQPGPLVTASNIDLTKVVVTIDGIPVRAPAREITPEDKVTRIVVLAIDNSRSMSGKLSIAKDAAFGFLDRLPQDVAVSVVSFSDEAALVIAPTSDRLAVRDAIDGLLLNGKSNSTAVYDALGAAADVAGDIGARRILLLTDGQEKGSTKFSLAGAASRAFDNGIAVDGVFIGNSAPPDNLSELIERAGGTLGMSSSSDLANQLQTAANAIKAQLLVTATIPDGASAFANVKVTARAGDTIIEDTRYTDLRASTTGGSASSGPIPVQHAPPVAFLTRAWLPVLLGAVFLGLAGLVYLTVGNSSRDDKRGRVRRRLSVYTAGNRTPAQQQEERTALGSSQVARSAVQLAGKVVTRRDFESGLAQRLEASGIPLRAAEWMIIQLAVAVGSAFLWLLISGGALFPTLVGLMLGLIVPWAYLLLKEGRRTSAFLAQLPDTLQLVAGSLSAGYSMAQAMDTVVREGQQPITGEFNRALVEARLGVPLEDAMEGIGERMKSRDFAWVVMAIRIQREVGGNLAELLTTVAGTLRERERLRRQVKVLSAEGRLSAWILGLLPLVFTLYLSLVRPEYLRPLVSSGLGWLLVSLGVTLLVVGTLWMSRAVRVEV